MTLVERFIEFQNWPASRKTALLAGLALIAHVFGTGVFHFAVGQAGELTAAKFQIRWMVDLLWCWLAAVAGIFGLSLMLALRRREGRWTPYLLILVYGAFLPLLMWLLGMTITALMGAAPMVIILVAVWYGPRAGIVAFLYGWGLSAALIGLQVSGRIPFAPYFLDRSLDAQNVPVFALATYFMFCLYFLFSFVLVLMLLAARDMQTQRLAQASRLIRRYIPAQVAEAILSGRDEAADQHERRKLTIFLSDLVGFTEIAEELEPEDLSRVLNEYFSEMTAIAQRHGGTVDELSGDAILIFFGAPHVTNDQDHALRAVRMAVDMQQAMAGLNQKWRKAGIGEALRVRMGINTGVVTIGNFGSPDRMKYAALGKHVNLAARLQAHCEPGKVLLSHATWLLVNDQIPCTPKGELQLKGIHKPVMTYELTS